MAAGTTVGEFVINLVVDAGKGELTVGGLVKSMGDLEVASVGEIAVLSGLAKALENLTGEAINHAMGLTHLVDTTNESTAAFEKWGRVASVLGLDKGQMQDTMKALDDLITSSAHDPEAMNKLMSYNRAGMHLQLDQIKTSADLIKKFREDDFFQSKNKGEQSEILRRGPIPDSWMPLLSKTVTPEPKLQHIIGEVGAGMTDSERLRFKELNENLRIAKLNAEKLGDEIAAYFIGIEIKLLHLLVHPMDILKKAVVDFGKEVTDANGWEKDFKNSPIPLLHNLQWEKIKKQFDFSNWDASTRTPQQQTPVAPNLSVHVTVPVTTKADPREITEHIVYHAEKAFSYHFNKLNLLSGPNVI